MSLYIVATPIGNLADITYRAVEILSQVDFIAAEDTRHSKKLLQHYDIDTPLISLHEHNEEARSSLLLRYLKQGKTIALISDAGTPLISDPGYRLVNKVRAQSIRVIPIPGPCAAITALSAAGLPTDQFVFVGFLPPKTRRKRLAELQHEERTVVIYEAPHRLMSLFKDMLQYLDNKREIVVAKELTKQFETICRAELGVIIKWLEKDELRQKGEFVILIKGMKKDEDNKAEEILHILLEELPLKQAVELAAKISGAKKNSLYRLALKYEK